jgi:hypothetical protein
MTHQHEEIRNTRTILLEGKSGLCVRPGSHQKDKGRDSAVVEAYVLPVL